MSLRAKATLLLTTYNPKSSNNLTKRIDSDAGDYSVKPKMKYCIRPSICQGIGNGQFDNMRQAILGTGKFRINGEVQNQRCNC